MNDGDHRYIPTEYFQAASLRVCGEGLFENSADGQLKFVIVTSHEEGRSGIFMSNPMGPVHMPFDARSANRAHGILWPKPAIEVDRETMYRVSRTTERDGDLILEDGRFLIVAKGNDGWSDTYRFALWGGVDGTPEEAIGFRAWRFVVGPTESRRTVFEWRGREDNQGTG